MKLSSTTVTATLASASLMLITACGGGGGGGHSSKNVIYYPYETVYGDVCTSSTPTPGCTFNRDGSRVKVTQDGDYNIIGGGSDDLKYVQFGTNGAAYVYDRYNNPVLSPRGDWVWYASDFPGYIPGTGSTIGVGTTGLFWENVSNGDYWLGRNNVLYNANPGEVNYGEAINSKKAGRASWKNISALNTESNLILVKKGADKLVKNYGFAQAKALSVASALNAQIVAGEARGYTTADEMNETFKDVFGVEFSSALSATKALLTGETDQMRALTNKSASGLGLQAHDAQRFMKDMYRDAAKEAGYDIDQLAW